MVTLVNAKGSAPQVPGAHMLVSEHGLEAGTIGGGKVELKAIELAQKMMAEANPVAHVQWNLKKDVGMTCGGNVSLFFENFARSRWQIAIFGAGHVANALVPLLLTLDCEILCIDTRAEWLNKMPDSASLQKICREIPEEMVKELHPETFVLMMSQGHAFDLPVLIEVLKNHDFPYAGVIGSNSKRAVLKKELLDNNIAENKIDSFICPIGLPLGNSTPPEIAISVCAQLLQKRDELYRDNSRSVVRKLSLTMNNAP